MFYDNENIKWSDIKLEQLNIKDFDESFDSNKQQYNFKNIQLRCNDKYIYVNMSNIQKESLNNIRFKIISYSTNGGLVLNFYALILPINTEMIYIENE